MLLTRPLMWLGTVRPSRVSQRISPLQRNRFQTSTASDACQTERARPTPAMEAMPRHREDAVPNLRDGLARDEQRKVPIPKRAEHGLRPRLLLPEAWAHSFVHHRQVLNP